MRETVVPAEPDAGSPAGQPAPTEVAEAIAPDVDAPETKLEAIATATGSRDRATLAGYLGDGDAAVQAAAFQELAAQSKDAAIESLLTEIRDPGQPSRLQAMQLLVQSAGAGETITMGTLRDALKDPDPAFNAYAIQMLAGYGDPPAIEALSDAFHGGDAATKLMIIEQLAGTSAGIPLLREAASDPDPAVSAGAAALLKGLPVGPGG
jgi:HEAT repeat protein